LNDPGSAVAADAMSKEQTFVGGKNSTNRNKVKGVNFMTAKDITLELIIRYGFQVLGAIIILTVGVLLAR
jgi:hypothetical protein